MDQSHKIRRFSSDIMTKYEMESFQSKRYLIKWQYHLCWALSWPHLNIWQLLYTRKKENKSNVCQISQSYLPFFTNIISVSCSHECFVFSVNEELLLISQSGRPHWKLTSWARDQALLIAWLIRARVWHLSLLTQDDGAKLQLHLAKRCPRNNWFLGQWSRLTAYSPIWKNPKNYRIVFMIKMKQGKPYRPDLEGTALVMTSLSNPYG